MPLYAFACARCEERFDALQGFDVPAPPCPGCGAPDARRVLSAFTAGPARKGPDTFTPAATRRDAVGGGHHHH